MTRGDDLRLADIRDACAELQVLVELRSSRSTPEAVTTRAAERLLEIIGEAGNSLSEDCKTRYSAIDWRRIGRLRILLAHHYFRTDPELIWTYATNEVPRLAAALS